MNRTFAAALIAALAMTFPAHAKDKRYSFTQDDVTYSYSVAQAGKSTIYRGHATPGGDFHLSVRNGRVTGMANGNRVAFDMSPELLAKAKASSASGTVIAAAR